MSTTLVASPALDAVLSRLEGVWEAGGQFEARCPVHDDRNASLSVGVGDDGRVLIHCHAGCAVGDVAKALGLTMKDLSPPTNGRARNGQAGKAEIVATYDYRDELGTLLFQSVRYDPKDFKQRKPKDGGGWDWKTKDCRKVLFRVPELLAAPATEIVYIPEGEKDVLNLVKFGFIATCNVGGAGKWRKEYGEHLRGRRVSILADKDDTGRKHSAQVAAALRGIAVEVKLIELPGEGKDVSDWIAAGGTAGELRAIVEASPVWTPTAKMRKPRDKKPVVIGDPRTPDLRDASGRTDVANDRRLIALHGDVMRWCDPWGKWLIWDGRRWAIDQERRAESLAKDVADTVWKEVGDLLPKLDLAEQVELIRFARASAGAKGIANMLSLARSELNTPILPERLDAQPWLWNCMNGTVDLRTGTLRKHDRAELLTKLCPHDFVQGPEGESPRWDEFLAGIFADNQNMIRFVQRLFGCALVGEVTEHVLPILWGDGSNGKTVLVQTLLHVFGDDYGSKAVSDLLLAKSKGSHPTERADLHGKRLVVCSETDQDRRLAEGLVKELTGGDTIKARRMFEDFWSFRPSHTAVLTTNHRPQVRGTDHGIWRRLRLVPFTQCFWDADKRLTQKLGAESCGILRWLVEGCLAWQREGLGEPAEVTEATASYRADEDVLGKFIAACCVVERHACAPATQLLDAFREYTGDKEMNQTKFGRLLADRKFRNDRFTAGKNKGRMGWWGIGLLGPESEG